MISALHEESPMVRIFALLERHGHRMARAGGGGLPGDRSAHTVVTPELVASIRAYVESGPHSYAEVGRQFKITPVLARTIMLRNGMKATDGRVLRHRK